MNTELSTGYAEAIGVHNHILAHAQIAQQSLWEIGTGIKKMRDGKLYKELGYQNFEKYCEQALGIKRNHAYKYISIVERLGEDFVSSRMQNAGINKLYLLSTLSEEDRQELTERVDVEDISTRQLKAEIDKLKAENSELSDANGELTKACQEVCEAREKAERDAKRLEKQVKELEARPIEVVAKDVNVDEAVSEALKAEEQKHNKQMDELSQTIKQLRAELEKIEDNDQSEELRTLEEKHKTEIAELSRQYEERIQNISGVDNKAIFKVYFKAAYDAFNAMMAFVKNAPGEEKAFLKEHVTKLLAAVEKTVQEV